MILMKPKPLSQIEKERQDSQLPLLTIGQELSLQKLDLMQKEELINMMGQEIAALKLEIIQLRGAGQ